VKSCTLFWRILKDYKIGAQRRLISWDLTDKDFSNLVSGNCYFCGSAPRPLFRKQNGEIKISKEKFNGIDRLDSSGAYTIGNVVSCCKECNYLKRALNREEFLEHVNKIYEFKRGGG